MHSNSIGCPEIFLPLFQFFIGYRIWLASRAWKRKTSIFTQLKVSRYKQHFCCCCCYFWTNSYNMTPDLFTVAWPHYTTLHDTSSLMLLLTGYLYGKTKTCSLRWRDGMLLQARLSRPTRSAPDTAMAPTDTPTTAASSSSARGAGGCRVPARRDWSSVPPS